MCGTRSHAEVQFPDKAFQFRKREPVQVVRPCPIPKGPFRAVVASGERDRIGQLAQQRECHRDAMQRTAAVPMALATE
ncbi:hypothetical protein DR62_05975 [Burkholderia thailandensis]|nr:hypothetical protein DR62_05975 [Burkholderia thailandensis]